MAFRHIPDISEILRLIAGRFRRYAVGFGGFGGKGRRVLRGKGVRLADFRVVFRNLCGPRRARGFTRLPFRHLFRVVGVPFAQSRRVDAGVHIHGELVQRRDNVLVQVDVDHLFLRLQAVEGHRIEPFLIAHQTVRWLGNRGNLGKLLYCHYFNPCTSMFMLTSFGPMTVAFQSSSQPQTVSDW